MTATATASAQPGSAEFPQVWAESFSHVLGQIQGQGTVCSVLAAAPPDLPPPVEADLWVACVSSGGLRGEMCFRLTPAVVLQSAQMLMNQTATPGTEITADDREAAVELLRQVAGIAASALRERWGEVQLRLDPAPGPPSWASSATAWIQVGETSTPSHTPTTVFELRLSAALSATLRAEKGDAALAPAASQPPATAATTADKLSLLMDVELDIQLRFGARPLLLREILELNPGTVVELDRQVEEPVDVLLDGRLVARGEVIVMDGNYGVRVTEVMLPPPGGGIHHDLL